MVHKYVMDIPINCIQSIVRGMILIVFLLGENLRLGFTAKSVQLYK